MVGNKGKGSKSKPKALKPETAETEPLELSLDGSAVVASDGKNGKDDISIGTEIPMAEEQEQMVEVTSGVIVSDGLEEKDQNALEDDDYKKDVMTEINVDRTADGCTQEGPIDDVKEVSDGGHVITHLSVGGSEERINTDNPEDDEAPLKFDNNDVSIGGDVEMTTKGVSANNEGLDSDHGLIENMIHNLENHKEPNELDAERPVGTTSDKKEEEISNITNEVKGATGNVTRPKKKVVKKVKKKLVKKNAVNKEMPQLSDENNVTGEASKTDADKHINIEEKAPDINDASVGECKADNNELVSNKEEAEVKPSVMVNKKRNRNRKKKAQKGHTGIPTVKDAQKPQSENNTAISEQDLKNEEAGNSGDKANLSKKSKKKKKAKKGSQEAVPKDLKKPKEDKSLKKVDSMGMIFMCSSETKKDCYRYNVLGLPSGKKDMVLKIYKGMRLFLFDVDQRMMYGIYKAAGPGGYNIEPSAFKSQFPSQVRFSVLADCMPLPEEKFKKALKDNYYAKNKFNFQLNSEQVKNLCKLFQDGRKKVESTKVANKPQKAAVASSSVRRDNKKRKRVEDSRRAVAAQPPPLEQERVRRRTHEETRRAPVVIVGRYHERPAYGRETYVPSVAPVSMYQPILDPRTASSRTYPYDRVSVVDPYRRETVIDRRDLAPSSRILRLPIEQSHYDSYVSYRDPPQVYSGQTYSSGTRTEQYDYGTSDRPYAEYHRPADHRPPPPLYRRY